MNGYNFSAKTAYAQYKPIEMNTIFLHLMLNKVHLMCMKGAYTEIVYALCLEEYIPIILIQNCVLRLVPYIQSLYFQVGEVHS